MPLPVLYDCDGTLIDSEHIAGSVCAEALTRIGYPITMEAFNARFNGVPVGETWRILRAEIPHPLPDGFNEAINAEIHRRFETELRPVPGVFEMLDALPFPRAVASSTGIDTLRRNLARTGLADRFGPHVYSASQVARGKPAPDVFLFAASQLGVDPAECLVIEDSVAGVQSARRAGMRAIGFTGACHGAPDIGRRLSEAGALAVIDRLDAFPALVRQLADA